MTPVFWLTNHEHIDAWGPWDTGLLQHLLAGRLWPTAMKVDEYRNVDEIPDEFHGERGVVILPARHHYSDADVVWLNLQIGKLAGVVLMLCGDEDAGFPWKQIRHDNIRFWAQMPDPANYADMAHFAYFFGNGWRVEFPEWAARHVPRTAERTNPWMFAGQVTNIPRKRAANGLRKAQTRISGLLLETDGFARGMDGEEYARLLADTWVAPCPGGPQHVDTFRLYEALESGCIPLVDGLPARSDRPTPYWRMLDTDLTAISDWDGVGGIIEALMGDPVMTAASTSAWWQQRKRAMVRRMEDDLRAIGCDIPAWSRATALVTTSPVPSNPDTDIIMETLASIPDGCEIVIACDGVRPEQESMSGPYAEFLYRIVTWCEHDAVGAVPFLSTRWAHQADLTRQALQHVHTPAVLFMEHDAPLVTDEPIDWGGCVEITAEGLLHVLRFHHESHVLPAHEHLMIDHRTETVLGVPLRRTRQWSQRPALYNSQYLRRILAKYFSPTARGFIEDRMHSVAQHERGHRLAIYHPDGGNIKRSYHLDARADAPKFDDSQVF